MELERLMEFMKGMFLTEDDINIIKEEKKDIPALNYYIIMQPYFQIWPKKFECWKPFLYDMMIF